MMSRTLRLEIEKWPLREPFRITGYTFTALDVLVVTLRQDGFEGRGEAAGVYYRNETPATLRTQVEAVRNEIETGIDREALQQLLPAGGARNAVDCALWDLEAKLTSRPAWQLAGFATAPRPLLSTYTLGADTPRQMAKRALAYTDAKALKLKLTGEEVDAERVRAVRRVRSDVWLGVDANQGCTRESLEKLLPVLVQADVRLIEQPLPIGHDADLAGLDSPIAIAADESAQDLRDMQGLVGRFTVVNIKLDKCGGLTHALAMAKRAQQLGLRTMVGNMAGTSLAMGPAFLIGQLCEVVDLDGPIVLVRDRKPEVIYANGYMKCPPAAWGTPA